MYFINDSTLIILIYYLHVYGHIYSAIVPIVLLGFTKYFYFMPIFILAAVFSILHHALCDEFKDIDKIFGIADEIFALFAAIILIYIFLISPKNLFSWLGIVIFLNSILLYVIACMYYEKDKERYDLAHSLWHYFALVGASVILISVIKK